MAGILAGSHASGGSTSRSQAEQHDFPLDPSLGGSSRRDGRSGYDDMDDGDDSEADRSFDEDEEDDDDETDAEEEYRVEMGGVKRKKSAAVLDRRASAALDRKGKGRAPAEPEVPAGFENRQDIGRLIAAIKEGGTGGVVGGRTALDMEFDRSIEEELDGIDDPLSFGKSRKDADGNRKPRGRRAAADIEPSPEVKALLATANRHYANGEYDTAIPLFTEIVRIDPGIRAPWYTLATIYEERGDKAKALRFMIIATHLTSAKQAASEWASLGAQSRDIGQINQAIYCFSQAIKGNKNDVDSMWDRGMLLKINGSLRQATTAFSAILKVHPHDIGTLRELAPLLANTGAHAAAIQLLTAAMEYAMTEFPHLGPMDDPLIGVEDLETLCDFLNNQHESDKVIKAIRTGVRWLQGREAETMWDVLSDDREYDLERNVRPGKKVGRFLEASDVYELDVRLRTRLGVARMNKGDVDEARLHFDIVTGEDIADVPELFIAVADSYLGRNMYDEALELYQDLAENEESNGPAIWVKIAACHQAQGNLNDALDCLVAAVDDNPEDLIVQMQLAKLFEQMNNPQEALLVLNTIIDQRKKSLAATDSDNRGSKKGGRPTLTKEQRQRAASDRVAAEQKQSTQFAIALQELETLSARVDEGDEDATTEWLRVATDLVDAFRETRQLFPADPKKKFTGVLSRVWRRKGVAEHDIEVQVGEMSQRLERSMDRREEEPEIAVDSFRGLNFDDWLALIVKYAILLTKNDEAGPGQETLIHVQSASVFKQSEHRTLTIKLARAACYIQTRNYAEIVSIARWISLHHQYTSAGLRLLQCLIPSGIGAIEAFNGSGLQKYAIRQLKSIDDYARGGEGNPSGTKAKKKGKGKQRDEDEDDEEEDEEEHETGVGGSKFVPTQYNPMWTLAYGHMLLTSGSYQSSIIYMLRAYEMAPEQPLISLSLAIAYVHRSMSRQSDNRQHQLAQGMTFLSQYRKLMGPCQVVEYNFGRMFQYLGLQSFAVKHYNACLSIASTERMTRQSSRMSIDGDYEEEDLEEEGPEDYARAAAYNLSNVYMLSGQAELARTIAHRWLTF